MATPRELRRLTFQLLFQIDARGGTQPGDDLLALRSSVEDPEVYSTAEIDRAMKRALAAYAERAAADAVMVELAPAWPVHRQAAVDRAILRLAYFEMVSVGSQPKVVVNEAVELAKQFSTEKSPAFINGLLDKVLKRVTGVPTATTEESAGEATDEPAPADAESEPMIESSDEPAAEPTSEQTAGPPQIDESPAETEMRRIEE